MGSDEFTMPKPEWCTDKSGSGARLYAYSCALSGKNGNVLASSDGKAKVGTGIAGLMKELEKTRLDTCDEA